MGFTLAKGRTWLQDPELRAFQREAMAPPRAGHTRRPAPVAVKGLTREQQAKARWERWLKTP